MSKLLRKLRFRGNDTGTGKAGAGGLRSVSPRPMTPGSPLPGVSGQFGARDINVKPTYFPLIRILATRTRRAQATSQVRERASPPVYVPGLQADDVGFGFSAGGLLFPYFIGIIKRLQQHGVVTPRTKMAGSSAGSLICACNALVPMAEVELACRDLVADMRKHGVYGRLRGTLEGMLQEILPEDAHVRVRGVTHVAVTRLWPTRKAELLTDFKDRDDLIQALLTSCHIPMYFDRHRPFRRFRDGWYCDGGLTNFIPIPAGVEHGYRVCCFPLQARLAETGLYPEGVAISPDAFNQDLGREAHPSMRQLLTLALRPYDDEQLTALIEMGEQHAEWWIRKSLTGSIWT